MTVVRKDLRRFASPASSLILIDKSAVFKPMVGFGVNFKFLVVNNGREWPVIIVEVLTCK